MNRILLDEKKVCNNFIINESKNYLIDGLKNDSFFKINNSNVNILLTNVSNDIKINIELNNSSLIFNSISKNINQNVNIYLNTKDSKVEVFNSMICDLQDNKINFNVYHNAAKTVSNIYNFCVTKKEGSAKINVISKCPRKNNLCNLNQNSKIISLNDNNKNKIEPILLIDEFDSIASHSCFIGKFNNHELFYLQSRGLNKKESYELLLNGFLIGVMKISEEEKNYLKEKYIR